VSGLRAGRRAPRSGERPSGGLRRVLLVNAADKGGGAERTAGAILDGFEALGTETRMAVGLKLTDDPRVIPLAAIARADSSRRTRAHRPTSVSAQRLALRLGLEDFEHPHSRHVLESAGGAPDLLLALNLHGGYFDLRILPALTWQVPTVLRLCDSWLFTGHCAIPAGCERWQRGCGACPDLATPPAVRRDATRLNWHRKRRILSACRLAVTAPSRWMIERAQRSLLAGAIGSAKVVPNGLDLAVFAPGPRAEARAGLGIDGHAKVLLFVANDGRANPYKDLLTLRAATELLGDRLEDGQRLELLVVGREGPLEIRGSTRIRHLARREGNELASLYRAADVYVHAAPEETFCNAAAEALACGAPVVAACAGGIREVVEEGRTGLHVSPGRPEELAAALGGLLGDEDARAAMGREAAERARERFDSRRNIAELHAWCEELAGAWRADTQPRPA
jgi:glycosyltransferase involved in cell wall biosynthesis